MIFANMIPIQQKFTAELAMDLILSGSKIIVSLEI